MRRATSPAEWSTSATCSIANRSAAPPWVQEGLTVTDTDTAFTTHRAEGVTLPGVTPSNLFCAPVLNNPATVVGSSSTYDQKTSFMYN